MANPRRFIIVTALVTACITTFLTLGGLYFSNRLGAQKESASKESQHDTREVGPLEQTEKVETTTEDLNPSDTALIRVGAYWKQQDNKYFMYQEGNRVDPYTTSSWSGQDLLVYNQQNHMTFLFEDFEKYNDNTLRPAKVLGDKKAYWKQRDNKYYLYYEGNRVDPYTTSSWSDSDLLVYDKKNKKTFLLEKFSELDDNTLRAAKELKNE